MIQRSVWNRAWTLTVLFSLLAFTTPFSSASDGTTVLRGVVLDAAEKTPVVGVSVLAGSAESGRGVVASQPTAADGSFSIDGLAPGSYELGIRSGETMFLVGAPVTLAAGENRPLDLLLEARRLATDASQPDRGTPTAKTVSGVGGVWDNPLTAALLVIGGAVIVGVIVDELDSDNKPNTTPASPF